MNKQQNNYQLLINKLDKFTRKYYVNKLIRGTLYATGLVLLLFLSINLVEHFLFSNLPYSPTSVRTALFFSFLSTSIIAVAYWVALPLLNLVKLGKLISHEQAAQMIGSHFTNVKDKLLNVLQLKEQANSASDASLINASIDQKIDDIKPVPFTKAIDYSKNRKYVKYALAPLLLLLIILVGAPRLIPDSTARIIKYSEAVEKAAPFKFSVNNQQLKVIQYEDLTVDVQVDGVALPATANIYINGFPYQLQKKGPSNFTYTFKKVQKEQTFFLEANGFRSKDYTIEVIPKPTMIGFSAYVNYPDYTEQKDETLKNNGDMVLPTGTNVDWTFDAQNTDSIFIRFGDSDKLTGTKRTGEQQFTFKKRIFKDVSYTIYLSNKQIDKADSISYTISVIPDLYPSISAQEKRDSSDKKYLYFFGDASDDYGIKNLYFKYKIDSEKAASTDFSKMPIDIGGKGRKNTSFTHFWDLNEIKLEAGDKLTYFFEVWDNDAVNGSKFARSQTMMYELPTIEEMDSISDEKNEQVKEDLEELVNEAKEIQEKTKDIKDKLVQKKELDWEDREQIEQLLNQHKQMEQKIENLQEQFNENIDEQNEYKEFSEDLQEKQQKLQELMDELMTDELKEMMEKLEELLEEMGKEDMMDELEDFEMSEEELEENLDRMLELFKQLEFEQKMNETIEELQELGEQQEELGEQTEDKPEGSDMSEQEQKQEELNEKFEDIKKEMEELQEMSDDLNNKMDLQQETQEQQEEISDDQQQSMEQMKQQQSQQAGQKQKDAGKKMKKMAQQMQMMQMQMQQDQMEEDMQAIRQLLENLVALSLEQEDLMENIEQTDINTPSYVALTQDQYKLKDDARLIEDSLIALSKRVFQLEAFITKELKDVNKNMEDAIDFLADRKPKDASVKQQFIMTGANNLALMLDESMQQMQQQMAQQMQGSQNCQKPGNKPGMKGLSQMQKQLNDQIKQLQQDMKAGKKPGGQMSKEAAQMAAKQQALRKAMKELNQQKNKDGKGSMGDLDKIAEEMEQTEEDIVNKQITAETLKRQQEILNKMLKAADAEREQEWDDKRLAKTAKEKERQIPPEIEEYLKKREAEVELYKTVPPTLKPHYKNLVEKYFQSISDK